jgi:hypothetical protein
MKHVHKYACAISCVGLLDRLLALGPNSAALLLDPTYLLKNDTQLAKGFLARTFKSCWCRKVRQWIGINYSIVSLIPSFPT